MRFYAFSLDMNIVLLFLGLCTAFSHAVLARELSTQGSPTASPTSVDIIPFIINTDVTAQRTSLTVEVTLTNDGGVYCGAFKSALPLATNEVIVQNFFSKTNNNVATVIITGLTPITIYNVYCYSVSNNGIGGGFSTMLATMTRISTLCCKELTVKLSSNSIAADTAVTNMVSVSLSATPASSLTVVPTITSNDILPNALYPANAIFTAATGNSRSFTLLGLSEGQYQVGVALSGASAAEYDVVYTSGAEFTVRAANAKSPAPVAQRAQFSSDAASILVSFNAPTNTMLKSAPFQCSELFSFAFASECTCRFGDASSVTILLVNKATLVVGGNVTMLGGKIRAKCAASTAVCATWDAAPEQVLAVQPPASPVTPVVSISCPISASKCSSPVLDIGGSSGSGGRQWTSVTFGVAGSHADSVARLQNFFTSTYKLNPPTSIPSGMLENGFYDITVSLCNFLQQCGSASHRLTIIDTTAPTVTIVGNKYRSMLSSQVLALSSNAYVASCAEQQQSNAVLSYAWKVSVDGLIVTLPQESRDPSKYRLASYTLTALKTYTIELTVTNTVSSLSSTTETMVYVTRGSLVAVISRGQAQSVRLGDSLVLDASPSYDEDVKPSNFDSSQYTYHFSCVQTAPQFNSSCGLQLNPVFGSNNKIAVTTHPWVAVNSVFAVTFTFSDSTRQSQTGVTITVTSPASPIVQMQTSFSTKVNPSSQIKLSSVVQLSYYSSAKWSLDDSSFDLKKLALTPVSSPVTPGNNVVNFVLMSNVLNVARQSYVFQLQCDGVAASVAVTLNSPPSRGTLSVSPLNGTELDTVFQLAAFEWVDDDLPLTFEFGYFSNTGLKQVVQARSELSYASSKLPAGREKASFELSVFSRVLDVYNGEATSMTNVVVQKLQLSSSDLKSKAQEQMSTVTNGGDAAKQILSVMSSVLNGRDCSAAPDCSAKNRQECSTVANTCGACLSGYVGEDGAANSMCDLASDDDAELTCASNNDCSTLDECVDAQCVRKSKSCPLGCSDHGACLYVQGDSDAILKDCKIGDTSCNAVCECVSGYEGSGCDVSATEMSDKQATRELLLNGLSGVANSDEVTEDNVISWVNSLSAMTIVSDELSASAASTASSVAKDILSSASTIGLTYDKLMGLLDSVSAATLATYANTARRRLQESEVDDTIDILTSYGTLTANEMVAGQSNVDAVYSLFSVSSQVSDYSNGSAVVTSADDGGASSCSVVTDEESDSVRAVVITTKSKMRGGLYSSNPFRLQLVNGSVKDAVFLLQNYVDALYEDYDYNITHRTDCEKGDYSSYEYECPVGDESIVVRHTCNGTKAVVRTTCPKVHKLPFCKILSGSPSFTCNVTKFTASETTCHCYQTEGRRLSSGLEGTGLLEVAALSVHVADDFAETILTADDLDSLDDLQEAMTVIFLYGSMWSIGLISIGMIAMKRNRKIKDSKESPPSSAVQDRLMKYIDTVMPVVFNAESGWKRLWREIVHHHRYIQMFTSTDNNRFNRVITGIHLLTVQTMLMFILAVLYDTEFPTDDGSCTAYLTEEKCLRDKSVFDQEASTCRWKFSEKKEEFHCVFAERQLTWEIIVIISVVVAMFTSPMNSIVDFIFIDILSAPAADEAKVEPTLTKIGRRVSTAVRRASQAIVQAVQPKKRVSSQLSIRRTRVLSDAAVAAHIEARESARDIIQSSMSSLTATDTEKKAPLKHQDGKTRLPVQRQRSITANETVDTMMTYLREDLTMQRQQLRRNELMQFDMKWGLDSRGEYIVHRSLIPCLPPRGTRDIIKREIQDVKKESSEKRSKLDAASDVQIGLEMMHLFVVDLLGRRTLAARLFITKSEEDFRHKIVLSRLMKVLLWGFVIVLNLFFVYFSMLRGLQRGSEWQRNFAFACVLHFIVEIVLYETSECVVMNFLVPNVATNEIRSAFVSVRQIVQRICQGAYVSYDHVLDAPQYLYVSTQLAKAYPHLLESALINSFHTYMPGDVSTKWNTSYSMRNMLRRLARSMTISALCLGLLRYFAMLPVELQRLMVHSVQPIIFSGILILLLYIRRYPFMAVMLVFPIIYLAFIFYREYRYSKTLIMPLQELPKMDTVPAFEESKADHAPCEVECKDSDGSIGRARVNDAEWQARYVSESSDMESFSDSSVYDIRPADPVTIDSV